MPKIGYQGLVGSNSEEAAKKIAENLSLTNVEFVPLISSKQVFGKLKRNEIDFGVVAIKNSIGGIVSETYEAIKNEIVEFVASEILPIHHSLFVKNAMIKVSDVRQIASHPQAIKQCKNNIEKDFTSIKLLEIEDTAIGAKYLSEGQLSEDTAVLCRKNAGEAYGLFMIKENFEDKANNETEFRMYKRNASNFEKASLFDKLIYYSFTDRGLGILTKGLMIGVIFISLFLQNSLGWSDFEAASKVGGFLSVIFLFLTSEKLKNWIRFRSVIGYWKYNSVPENQADGAVDQKYEVPRVVKIDEVDGELVFKGWMCDKENVSLFKSEKVLISPLGARTGRMVYWYNTPSEMGREFNLNGIVTLGWELKNPASKIHNMSGWYMGKSTNEIGSLKYLRISKDEFEIMRTSDYLS